MNRGFKGLVLSLFPGIGLLDMAFEEAGFCVVRGPDNLWGGEIAGFHPPAGRFDGIIGGPPCQTHSTFAGFVRHNGLTERQDQIPEFARCVEEAACDWFLMENVRGAPAPDTPSYGQSRRVLNARHVGSEQNRIRAFTFGARGRTPRFHVETDAFEPLDWCNAVLASGGMKPGTEHKRGRRRGNEYGYHGAQALAHAIKAQGLPSDFLAKAPFTAQGKFLVVGNGVPLPMGRAVAAAVLKALDRAELAA